MQKTKKLLAMMLMMASVFFFSCSDDEVEKLTTEEVKAELTSLSTDMSGYLDEMSNSEGMKAIEVLMGMPDLFVNEKSISNSSVVPNIKSFLLPVQFDKIKSTMESEYFDFHFWAGTYTWNAEHVMWSIVFDDDDDLTNDKIVINFPTEGSTTNDATITIHDYDEIGILHYDDQYEYLDYYPTVILADLYIHDVKIVEIDAEATWITTGDAAGEPSSLDISVYLTPFTFTGNFDHTSSAASIDFAISYNNESIFSAGVNATFLNDDMDDPLTVGGYVQLLNVKVEADVDVRGLEAIFTGLDDETYVYNTLEELADAINEEIDAIVYIDGVKVADIEIAFEEEGLPFDIVFVYLDGSTESALPYFESFILDIEDLFFFLDDSYSGI